MKEPCEDQPTSRRGHGTEAGDLLRRAEAGDEDAFGRLADTHRRELQIHCYRILGSVQDAEDLVQETLLAAWRGLDRFEGRTSLRSWLYMIATNRCLNALRDRGRRLPQLRAPPAEAPEPPEPSRVREPIWLEPFPDALLEGVVDRSLEPDARYEAREAMGLAFVAGLQRLPPRQRAVLVLRDVLGYRAREVAEMLGASEASVTSALHRARSALDAARSAGEWEQAPLERTREERDLVARFTEAFEGGEVDASVSLLTEDAWLTMPPEPLEYQGPVAIGRFLSTVPAGGRLDMFRSSRPAPTANRPSAATCATPKRRSRTPTGSWS